MRVYASEWYGEVSGEICIKFTMWIEDEEKKTFEKKKLESFLMSFDKQWMWKNFANFLFDYHCECPYRAFDGRAYNCNMLHRDVLTA